MKAVDYRQKTAHLIYPHYRLFRRSYRELGLYRPEYIEVDLDEIFLSEASESAM